MRAVGEGHEMTQHIPGSVFEKIVSTLHEYYGEDWTGNQKANKNFSLGAQSVFRHAEGVQLMGEPVFEHGHMNFNLWIDAPVDDVLAADELAFRLFAELADDVFACTRLIEDRGVRYRFITGNGIDGHLGSINFTGPNAIDFVNMHRLRAGRGIPYNA